MTNPSETTTPTPECNQAVKKYREGRKAWNEWVEKNQVADIDFSNVIFPDVIKVSDKDSGRIDFAGFKFPSGKVDFSGAQFGDAGVSFANAKFGKGKVIFAKARFGEGKVVFKDARFGKGKVDFAHAWFGEEWVDFRGTRFGDGDVSFFSTWFGDGGVSFLRTQFGKGEVTFGGAKFGDGYVDFRYARFVDGVVGFFMTEFGKEVDFRHAWFGKGEVSFRDLVFNNTRLLNFRHAQVDGNFVMKLDEQTQKSRKLKELDLSHSQIHRTLKLRLGSTVTNLTLRYGSFSGAVVLDGMFPQVPDLRSTRFDHHVDLSKLEIDKAAKTKEEEIDKDAKTKEEIEARKEATGLTLWEKLAVRLILCKGLTRKNEARKEATGLTLREKLAVRLILYKGLTKELAGNKKARAEEEAACLIRLKELAGNKKARAEEEAACLIRLKELAENHKNHEAAMNFFAWEMRCNRPLRHCFFSILDFSYDKTSNYGRSIARPLFGMIVLALPTLWLLMDFAVETDECLDKHPKAFNAMLANSLRFIPGNWALVDKFSNACLQGHPWLQPILLGLALLSFILLFLLGLALRNRFRL